MPSATVAALGSLDYAKTIGKKTTESDVALLTFKEGDTFVSMIAPARYPDKVQTLAFAVNSADAALIEVSAINRELGESILAVDAAGITKGCFVLRNFLQADQIRPIVKGTTLEDFVFLEDDAPKVRATLASFASAPNEGEYAVPIDHHFPVKGIGTVILGFVTRGVIKKHAEVRVYPTPKKGIVRSIQVHDIDVAEAGTGDHVGLALKGIENEDLDRGFVLAPEGSLEVVAEGASFAFDVDVQKFYRAGLNPGGVYYLAWGWQFVPAKLVDGTGKPGERARLTLELRKPLAWAKGEHGILINLEEKAQRIIGRATPVS